MKNYSENLKATFFLGIASFVTSGINYLMTPIFTRLMTTAEFGLVSKYNSAYLIISVIATLTLSRPGILSVGFYEHKSDRWTFLSSLLGEVFVCSLVTFLFISLLWKPFGYLLSIPFSLVILIIVSCVIQPAMTFWTYKQRYEYKWKSTFLVNVFTAIFAQTFSVLAVIWFKKCSSYNLGLVRLFSAAAINLLVSMVIYFYIIWKGRQIINLGLWRKTFLFAVPLIPHYFGFALLSGIDKLMIGSMIGDDKAGIYSLAAVISTIGALVWQALCVSITPFIFEKLGTRQFEKIDVLTKPLLELVGLFCIAISFSSPEIILVMGTEEYSGAAYVIPAAAAGAFMHVMYDLFSNVAFSKKKSVQIMTATVIAASANVALNYIFIKNYGYIAAGYTTLISYIILAFLHYRNARKIEKTTIFDSKYDVLISLLVIIFCLISIPLYDYSFIRYFVILAIIITVIARRNKYISAIGEMKV